MKSIAKFLLLSLSIVVFTTACNNENKPNPEDAAGSVAGEQTEEGTSTTRGVKSQAELFKQALASVKTVDALDQQAIAAVNVDELETITISAAEEGADDAAIATSIFNSLMSTEKVAGQLDVKFSMADEPVKDGIFVFAIESGNAKDLTLEMYDEEGYEMAANNVITIAEGKNYKALNVRSLRDGTYIFKLVDGEGKELVRTVDIIRD